MIKLKQVRLVNWYGFNQITVPVHIPLHRESNSA